MSNIYEEDIFDDDAIDIVIRFDKKAVQLLNKQNHGTFDDLKNWLNTNQYK